MSKTRTINKGQNIRISLHVPIQLLSDAREVVREGRATSVAELIRRGLEERIKRVREQS